jgi:3-deoxy-manno-octulosonate cytidylyltransferase (CMP-KDO synthetase)
MTASGEAVVVIPARFGSVRLPGKPLLRRTGKYLVQHVVERAREAELVSRVLVATDDHRIVDALEAEGIDVMLTSSEHPCGTDRVREAVSRLKGDVRVVVNVQGDEPETEPEVIDELVRSCGPESPFVTAATAIHDEDVFRDPARVKVVRDARGFALYFSRSPIPHHRDGRGGLPGEAWLHLGIYAYTPAILERMSSLSPSPLETTESLEQLRALENGISCLVRKVASISRGIDTPKDYEDFVARYSRALQRGGAR